MQPIGYRFWERPEVQNTDSSDADVILEAARIMSDGPGSPKPEVLEGLTLAR